MWRSIRPARRRFGPDDEDLRPPFDESRFLRIQSGAIGHADGLRGAVAACLDAGARNIFFLGTGGAAILMHPAAQILGRQSEIPIFAELSAELVAGGHRKLGPGSIVVIPSLSGTTKESVDALAFCQARGAKVIALVGHPGTPLADRADHAFVNFAEDDTSCESFYLQSLLIALAVMAHRGEWVDTERVVAELRRLPPLLVAVKRAAEGRAAELARVIANDPYHIIVGAGATWPQAWYYGMCILEEMQWIRTRPVHASDFFHGTLELVEKSVSVLLFKGEDAYRGLVERVERFLLPYTDKITLLDAAAFPLPGISADVRALLSPVILATVLERVSAHLEVLRDHPLTTRRYYKRVAY
ncbi:MAG: SIS domain-containing protein [Alphaproteobacteria bacterium]|nr:SIS domain-containing protein [Alphaproteobacteria bacterium]